MNFNYDLMTWIEFFIGSFICCFGMVLIGKILLNYSFNNIKWYKLLLLIPFSIIIVFNSLIFDNLMKIFCSLFVWILIYKLIYKQDIIKCLSYSIIGYILFVLADISLALIISLIMLLVNYSTFVNIVQTIIGNILVICFASLYSKIMKKFINKNVNKIDKSKIVYVLILGIITIFVLISSMYNLYLNNWKIDYNFVINIIVFIGCLILAIVLLRQYLENKDINDKYSLLEDYLKTSAELIERYSTTVHKYKNNLIAIKGYLKVDENKANNYIDSLLDDYNSKKYNWFNKINYIQIDGLRYLVYYKLSKAESNNLIINVDVSKDIKKYNNDMLSIKDNNNLLDIIGELFDNAIYASNESKDKELNVIVYNDDNQMYFVISNTYNNKVDLSLITKNGYTTKGNGHGLGLYDIDKTIKKNKIFKVEYEIIDKYFTSTLIINAKEKNKI